ncbi:hypothetical protein [Streptomyces sp. NPDC088725]|uniref:hypothetical protein n=1 Tax=Streptomyces sp. NPDC088725 TaxID=3365873 RepID=UPI0037FC93FB
MPAESTTPDPSGTDGGLSKAAREAAAQRAAAAPSGDPVGPKNTGIPEPGDYGFGKTTATAEGGEVVAYAPRLESGRLYVPLTMHNAGDQRVAYTVTVTVSGGDQRSPLSVTEKAANVFPGTTWPAQADITASGSTSSPDSLRVSLTVVKDIYPFGDFH